VFAKAPVEPDVQSNVGTPQGRVFVIVLDDLHTYAPRTLQVRRAARRFIEQNLGAKRHGRRRARVGRAEASQDFTGNKRLLLEAVDKFMARSSGPSSSTGSTRTTGRRCRPAADERRGADRRPGGDGARLQRAHDARHHRQHRRAAVRRARPPQAMVLFSEGIEYNIYDPFTNPRGEHRARRPARRHRVGHPVERGHLRRGPARPRRPLGTRPSSCRTCRSTRTRCRG